MVIVIKREHTCQSSVCPNPKGEACYVPKDGGFKGEHFLLTQPIREAWANAISAGEATVKAPSLAMWDQLKAKRGATTFLSRAPKAQTTRAAIEARIDKLEERHVRIEEIKSIRRLGKLADDDDAPARCPQYHPQYAPQYAPQQPLPLPQLPPQIRSEEAPAGPPQASSSALSMAELRSSSPITDRVTEPLVFRQFWKWKLTGVRDPEQEHQLRNAEAVCCQLGYWTPADLRQLSDTSTDHYRQARDEGVKPGIMANMRRDLKTFKHHFRSMVARARERQTQREAEVPIDVSSGEYTDDGDDGE